MEGRSRCYYREYDSIDGGICYVPTIIIDSPQLPTPILRCFLGGAGGGGFLGSLALRRSTAAAHHATQFLIQQYEHVV
jgi:hypothetical protein